MKKFLTLVLALVMALAIASPAMAFIAGGTSAVGDMTLDIYLVEYEDAALFRGTGVFTSLPADDIGYVTNEVVAAVVELVVPAGQDGAQYTLRLTGEEVKFLINEYPIYNTDVEDVNDDNNRAVTSTTQIRGMDEAEEAALWGWRGTGDDDGWILWDVFDDIYENDGDDDVTYAWLCFAKVTGDEASLTITLQGNAVIADFEIEGDSFTFTYDDEDYTITIADLCTSSSGNAATPTRGYSNRDIDHGSYSVADENGTIVAMLYFNSRFTADRMHLQTGGNWYEARMNGAGDVQYFRVSDTNAGKACDTETTIVSNIEDDRTVVRALNAIYEDLIVEGMGMSVEFDDERIDPDKVQDALTSARLEATVDIEPWQAYVTIPDVEVSDPPKTGDAATLAGFVMIIAAFAGVVVFKKVRA